MRTFVVTTTDEQHDPFVGLLAAQHDAGTIEDWGEVLFAAMVEETTIETAVEFEVEDSGLPWYTAPEMDNYRNAATGKYDWPEWLSQRTAFSFWGDFFNHDPVARFIVNTADKYGYHMERYASDGPIVIDGERYRVRGLWRGNSGVGCLKQILKTYEKHGPSVVDQVFALAELKGVREVEFTGKKWRELEEFAVR